MNPAILYAQLHIPTEIVCCMLILFRMSSLSKHCLMQSFVGIFKLHACNIKQ